MNCLMLDIRARRAYSPDDDPKADARRAIMMASECLSRMIPFDDWLRLNHRNLLMAESHQTVVTELLTDLFAARDSLRRLTHQSEKATHGQTAH